MRTAIPVHVFSFTINISNVFKKLKGTAYLHKKMACTPDVFMYGKRDGSDTCYIYFISLIQTQGHVVRQEHSKIIYIQHTTQGLIISPCKFYLGKFIDPCPMVDVNCNPLRSTVSFFILIKTLGNAPSN